SVFAAHATPYPSARGVAWGIYLQIFNNLPTCLRFCFFARLLVARGGVALFPVEGKAVAGRVHLDPDRGAFLAFLAQDLLGERVFHELLDGPAQRTSPEFRVIPFVDDELFGTLGDVDA